MGVEIERKFLFKHGTKLKKSRGKDIAQGTLRVENPHIRVRIYGKQGFLTFKTKPDGNSIVRGEWEVEIPLSMAQDLLLLTPRTTRVYKTRYEVPYQGHIWEVDIFSEENEGLAIAEIELSDPEDSFSLPPWVGKEVTDDPKYLNVQLGIKPFSTWGPS